MAEIENCAKCGRMRPPATNYVTCSIGIGYCDWKTVNKDGWDKAHQSIMHEHLMGEPPAIPMILNCPCCHARHVDKDEWATKLHHTHACQHCGMVWRPAIVATVGVDFLPGFKHK
jgi:hypothetical protein